MKKKSIVTLAAFALGATCATFAVAGEKQTTSADAQSTFAMDGAAVRYEKNSDGKEGIRFRVKVDKNTYDAYLAKETTENATIETGVLAIPKHELGSGELTVDTAKAEKAITYTTGGDDNYWTAYVNNDGTTDETYLQSLVYCYGIEAQYQNAPFVARGYVKVTKDGSTTVTYTTNTLQQSYLETAYRASKDTDVTADHATKLAAILNLNTYTVKYDGTQKQTGKYGDAFAAAPAADTKTGWEFVGWSVDGKTVYDTATSAYIKGNVNFTSLWNKVNTAENEAKVITGITGKRMNATAKYGTSYEISMDTDAKNEIGDKTLQSLTVAGETATGTYADGKITVTKNFTADDLKTYGKKKYTAVFAGTDGETLTVVGDVLFITYEIKTKDELDAMVYMTNGAVDGNLKDESCVWDENGNYVDGSSYKADASYGGYIVLGANIAYNGGYQEGQYSGNYNWTFSGTFDGRGYNIEGISPNYAGVFGALTTGATIRNLSITNATNSDLNPAGFLAQGIAWDTTFTIENIYVHFKKFNHCNAAPDAQNNGGYTGIIFNGEQWNIYAAIGFGTVKNVFVAADEYVANAGSGTILGNAKSGYAGFTNIYGYGIGGKISKRDTTTTTACGGVYDTKADIVAANIDFSAFEAEDFWQIDLNGLPYPAKLELKLESSAVSEETVIQGITGEGKEATITGYCQAYTISVKDVQSGIAGTLTSLTVGKNTYTDGISYEDGIITVGKALTLADYGYTDYTAVFTANGKELKVVGQVLFITYSITTKAELDTMVYVTDGVVEDVVKTNSDGSTSTTKTYGGYIVLANDIDYGGLWYSAEREGKIFRGTFDGRGHNIDKFYVGYASFFGTIGQNAVIKNVSFTNAQLSSGANAAYLAQQIEKDANGDWNNAFVIENIYIHFEKYVECIASNANGKANFNSPLISGESWSQAAIVNGTIKNVVIVADNYVKGAGFTAIAGNYITYGNPPITNVYAYGFGSDAKMIAYKDNSRTGTNYGVYDTKSALTSAVTDFSAFKGDFWTTDSDGVPVAKSAKAVFAAAAESEE